MDDQDLREEGLYLQARREERVWQESRQRGISRRRLLQVLAAGTAATALAGVAGGRGRTRAAPAPAELVVKPTPPEWFYDFGSNKEMRWENLYGRGYLVPNELFFIRNHTRTPRIDVATWRLRVEGSGVARPLELTYDDILAMPAVSVIRYIECAGNGRSFFEATYGRRASGTQWRLGAVGVAEWTGVPLREVLDRAGLKRTARDVMPEGLDELRVRRPMSIAKALEEDTLLVYAMNGQPLPPDHGFPVRVLVPGWIGIANIKWVGRIEVSEQPLYSAWNTDSYVMIGPDYQPQPPARGPILTLQNLKSAFELPWEGEVAAGRRLVRGRSWSPVGRIARVEYSLDRGITWHQAQLREPNIARAWARWDFVWEARPGTYSLRVRATDERGNTQPAIVPFNEQGYLFNAVIGHPLTVR
ncbi:MAG: sulfite oxidase [Armatimonadota bacterium]|nr:sulfite oxidase [Armatimonadota bacterium]MDR7459792.1 sulfite oxidase [Armatimonadota bacterium]MDR7480277.1 sulfite oxidase [Armatimonadota bacterium]MDR7492303.1 sulfite oxidase [Armatimonadota bacterium]MDR7502726.1 sulfite oxidase [Armatimonadota bacterium]